MDASPADLQLPPRRRWLLWAAIGPGLAVLTIGWPKSDESMILGRAGRLRLGQTREQVYSVMGPIDARGGVDGVSWDSQANQQMQAWKRWVYAKLRLKRPRYRKEDELVYVRFDADGLADHIKCGSQTVKRQSQAEDQPSGLN